MSSFEASGAALLAHRSLLGEQRERVGARHRCLESRCGLIKSVDKAYDEFDNKEPWDEVLS